MQFFKLFLLTILFSFNIQAETWSFEKNDTEEGINYSSFVFSENYEDFFSIYCSDNDNEVYFLVNFKDENLFADQEDLINVYFDNDRTNEHVLVVDYDKGSAFFNKSSFFIGYNNSYQFNAFIDYIKKSKKITFLTNINKRKTFTFNLKNSFNSLNTLSKHCNI